MTRGTLSHRSEVTNSQAAISARNLTLTLGTAEAPVEILRGVDLDVMPGETVALLGPSGSGKSSLMAVLSGLERASGGTLQVAGEDFVGMGKQIVVHRQDAHLLGSQPSGEATREVLDQHADEALH